jgi:hypothetical protein
MVYIKESIYKVWNKYTSKGLKFGGGHLYDRSSV